MQKTANQKKSRSLEHIKVIAVSAFLAAFSIILGKYLAINFGDTIRLSFENLPILLAGFYFGPWVAAAVGIVADLVGCLLVGYTINPIITLGAAIIGLCAGFAGKLPDSINTIKVLLTVVPVHIIGSVIIKTIGLAIFYQMPFWATLGWRLVTYIIISILEFSILFGLSKNRAFSGQMKKFGQDINSSSKRK